MITLNNKSFAKNKDEMLQSLFDGKTCIGYYRVNKKSITLYDFQGARIGGINQNKVLFRASQPIDQRWYHQAVPPHLIDDENYTYAQEKRDIDRIFKDLRLREWETY